MTAYCYLETAMVVENSENMTDEEIVELANELIKTADNLQWLIEEE